MHEHLEFPHLFRPLKVGPFELPNRIIMGSMHTGLEEEANGMDQLARFYAERARGESGLIVTGGISPNYEGVVAWGGARMMTRRHATKHKAIPEAVHAEGEELSCKFFTQGVMPTPHWRLLQVH